MFAGVLKREKVLIKNIVFVFVFLTGVVTAAPVAAQSGLDAQAVQNFWAEASKGIELPAVTGYLPLPWMKPKIAAKEADVGPRGMYLLKETRMLSFDSWEYDIGYYFNGRKEGIHRRYDGISFSLIEECKYEDGRPVYCKGYDYRGVVRGEQPYKDGKKHGPLRCYDEQGELVAETPYVNGVMDGVQREYDLNGELVKAERVLKNDVLLNIKKYNTGYTITHASRDITQRLSTDCDYEDGDRMRSRCRYYYPDGRVFREIQCRDGLPSGINRGYYQNGTTHWESRLDGGKEYLKTYGEDGVLQLQEVLTPQDGQYLKMHDDAQSRALLQCEKWLHFSDHQPPGRCVY